jgi:transcriptional regulator with XRE-family HTH domain
MNSGKRIRKLSPFIFANQGFEGEQQQPSHPNEFEGPYSAYMMRRSKQSSLKMLRRARGLTLEGLSELTGISPSYLSRLEGGARRLNTDLLERLSAVLGCQPGELLNLSGASSNPASRNIRVAHDNHHEIGHAYAHDHGVEASAPQKDLPVYSVSTPLGILPGASEEATTIDFINPADWTFRPPQLLGIPTAFALYVKDDENAPKYMTGDALFVHPTRPLSPRCSVVVLTKNDHALVRQFWGWSQEHLLVSLFAAQEPQEKEKVPREELRAVYKIIGTLEDH